MINVNSVLTIHDQEIVPVRAIPFVTGGDMGPRCLASILADPEQNFLAYVLGPKNAITPMLPKHWRQYKAQLSSKGPNAPDLYTRTELVILPASTFVFWEDLWRTHEVNFLPPRELIAGLSDLEQSNCELEPNARIPKELVKLVFDDFEHLALTSQTSDAADTPPPITTSDIAHSFAGLGWRTAEEWMKPLADKPKWLATCIVIPGSRGGPERRWNPVLIGAALIQRGDANAKRVRAKFQTMSHLKPWLESWKDYEADNLEDV